MYSRPIVPKEFVGPTHLQGGGFHLRMLTVDDLVKDYDAVMASRETLPRIMPPDDCWPEGLTLTDNRSRMASA